METELIVFHADWCGPCHQMEPVIDELKEDLKGKVKFSEIDIDKEPELAEKYGVMSIPNFVILKGGKQVDQVVGVVDKEILAEKLN